VILQYLLALQAYEELHSLHLDFACDEKNKFTTMLKEEWRSQKMMDFEGWNALHL